MPKRDGKYCATAIHGEMSCKNHSFNAEVPVYVFISSKMVGVDVYYAPQEGGGCSENLANKNLRALHFLALRDA